MAKARSRITYQDGDTPLTALKAGITALMDAFIRATAKEYFVDEESAAQGGDFAAHCVALESQMIRAAETYVAKLIPGGTHGSAAR